MRRMIVQPAEIATALAELKSWLAISRQEEDDLLEGLLRAALDTCESFIDRAPLFQTVEERVPVSAGSQTISSRPVRALVSAELIAQDGSRSAVDAAKFDFVTRIDGCGRVTIIDRLEGQALALRLNVGIAADWATLPAALKQGVIRLAAYEYRERDRSDTDRRGAMPPSSVTALWGPWRKFRLA